MSQNMKALKWQLMQSKLSILVPSIKFVNKCIQTQRLSTRRFKRQTAMLLSLESHIILHKWNFMCFIAEKLRSQEAELTARVRAMHTKRYNYNSWKASLYGSKNLANSNIVHGTSSFSFVRSIFLGATGGREISLVGPPDSLGTAPDTTLWK